MRYQRFGNQYVLRLMPGEEVMATLCDFVEREEIPGGYFVAFGAFERVCLQYFDIQQKQYHDNPIDRQVEVVSLMGNIAWQDARPKLHIHGAFGDGQANTCSGHVASGIVRPTLEVFLTRFDGQVRREKDRETGLDLLALPRDTSERDGQETDEESESITLTGLGPYSP